MKKYILRSSLALLAVSALLFSFTTRTYKSDFSGTWALNEGKSELGNFARFTVRKIKAEQKDDAISITRTSPSFNGGEDNVTTENLTFDGKTSESTGVFNSKKKTTAKWSDDGKSLISSYTATFERGGQTVDVTGTETWVLSEDGKSLTVTTNSTSPQGERNTKAVYDKQ